MRSLVIVSTIIFVMIISCQNRDSGLICGDGKKRLAANIWIARTSGAEYVLVDNRGESIIYGELVACKVNSNTQFYFRYKDFDSGKTMEVALDENGSKVDWSGDAKGMIDVGEFYESIHCRSVN